MEIFYVMQQDHRTNKLDTGWRVRVKGTANPNRLRSVYSDGFEYWAVAGSSRIVIDAQYWEGLQLQYQSRVSGGALVAIEGVEMEVAA